MAVLRLLYLLALSGCGFASIIRTDPHAEVSVSGTNKVLSSPSTTLAAQPKSQDESTTESQTSRGPPSNSKVHVESSVPGFETIIPTTTDARETPVSTSAVDVGSLIITMLPPTFSGTYAAPSVHTEKSRSGFEPQSYPPVNTYVTSAAGHIEVSQTSWESQYQPGRPPTQTTGYQQPATQNPQNPPVATTITQYKPGRPAPEDPQPTQQLPPGSKGDQPPVTTAPARIVTDYPPPPALIYEGLTIKPAAVTHISTLTLPGGAVTTTEQIEFQLAVGSSTLGVGTPVTINNVVVGLTTDAAGSTVLRAGDTTTTLPAPTAGEVRTVAWDTPGRLRIVTAIIDGTTKYVVAGQTLAPGQPVTIGDMPISIATGGGHTVLFVGDKSTTLPSAASDIKTLTESATLVTETQGTGTNTVSAGATPTTKKSESPLSRKADATLAYLILAIVLMITA